MSRDRAVEFRSAEDDLRVLRLTYEPEHAAPSYGTFSVEIRADGLAGTTTVATISGDGFGVFLAQLAEDWTGWQGTRHWSSLERDLSVDATHHGNRVRLLSSLLRAADADSWELRLPIYIEPGESMSALAAAMSRLVSTG